MGIQKMIETLRNHPEAPKMGMIASHLGVVRGTSVSGRKVSAIEVTFDDDAVQEIISKIKEMNGIVDVLIETYGGRLKVGDEIMAVVVGGDIRDHVFPALMEAVDRIKEKGSHKKEFC